MNKYRILTTGGEWLYMTLKPTEDRILTAWVDKDGQQMLDPRVRFKPETFGKFTEIVDENKKEIYTGDIVTIHKEYVDYKERSCTLHTFTGLVKFNARGVTMQEKNSYEHYLTRDRDVKHSEIIGNIFENPELLEKAK